MQIKAVTLFFCLTALLLKGEAPASLLPEWQRSVPASEKKVSLPNWRIINWGRKLPKKKHSGRYNFITAVNGRLHATLENPDDLNAVNMLYRSLVLKDSGKMLYRLKAVMVNNTPQKALVRLRMTGTGARNSVQQRFFTVSGTPSEKELLLTVPAGSRGLQITLALLGPGKVTFSELQLTRELPPSAAEQTAQLPSVFTLPEKNPVELEILLPKEFKLLPDNSVNVTLPWGVRLISHSHNVTIKDVALKVRRMSVTTLKKGSSYSDSSRILLLLGSDLAASDKVLSGSVSLSKKDQSGEEVYFRIRTVKDSEAVPPRHFKIALSSFDRMSPHENSYAVDSAMLRSGANILFTPRTTLQPRQLRTAKMSQRHQLHLTSVRAQKHCYYGALRDETFWGKHFIPALRRQILQYGTRNINTIVCDSFLGQQRAIFCCCTLCRTEFADFAPHLPQRDIMYLSQGILNARYAKDLRKFRQARLRALWAGARLHIPVDSRSFTRRPALIPLYSRDQVWTTPFEVHSQEAVLELQPGVILPDDKKYDPAINFLAASALYKKFRKTLSQRTALTARITPLVKHISPEELKFDLFNLFFCGFSGVWIDLPPGTDYAFRAAIARCSSAIRENESFFRRKALAKHNWILKSSAPVLEIPPVVSSGGTLLELPRSCAPLKLLVWEWGGTTLIAIGNFSSGALTSTLLCPAAPSRWQGMVNGKLIKGSDLRTKGTEVTVPPRSWIFLKFKGI